MIPGGMIALFDTALLLATQPAIDWRKILRWLEGPKSAIDLFFLASYLDDRALVSFPEGILDQMRQRQPHSGSAHTRFLYRLIDRHVVEGRPLYWPLSEGEVERLWSTLLQPGPSWRNWARLARDRLLGPPGPVSAP